MQRFLATPGPLAHFDFLSLIVVLDKYDVQYKEKFQRAINWEPGEAIDAQTMDYRALLKHEVTHFLDTTTSAWGRQYTFRKLRMLSKWQNGTHEFANAAEVFALETTELELHTVLVEAGTIPPASCDTINHVLIYREEFGVCVLIRYLKDGQCHHKVPLSMLSLLEANATASEFLSLIQCAESHKDAVDQQLAMEDVHRRFDNLLNDPELLEYSTLIHLIRVHFRAFSLAEQLKLIAALARFSLDASILTIGPIANEIQQSFTNKALGDALTMELRRDSHRQLIFFKTALFMFGWLQTMSDEERREAETLLRMTPTVAIQHMWAHLLGKGVSNDLSLSDEITEMQVGWMRELGIALADSSIVDESSKANRVLLETSSAGLISFTKLKLLNAIFSDDSELIFPNHISICVPDYYNKALGELIELDRAYREMKHERFHLPPGSMDIVRLNQS